MKKVLIGLIVIAAIAGGAYWYVFHKPHRDVQSEEAQMTMNASDVLQAYKADVTAANEKYVDKTVEVKGIISEVGENMLVLEPGVICTMTDGFKPSEFKQGLKVVVKGRIISFDEMFEEVRVDNAAVVSQ